MLWHLITLGVASTTLLLVVLTFRDLRDLRTQFVLLAVWARFVLSAFHEYTYPAFAAGLSINAMFSITVACGGIALVPPRFYLRARLLPIALLLYVMGLSAILNGEYVGLFSVTTRWLYFLAIALLLYRAFLLHPTDKVLSSLLAAASTPLILQIISVLLNHYKVGPDGQISFIGGYAHEASFSLMLMTIFCIVSLLRWRYVAIGLALTSICVAGIFLANYRSTIIAIIPLLLIFVFITTIRYLHPLVRVVSLPYIFMGGIVVASVVIAALPERYLEIFVVVESWRDLIKPPEWFDYEEQALFSGRIHLWAEYISAWLEGSTVVHVLGFGPEAWRRVHVLYAHNQFVSYLYEFGVVGVVCLLVFLAVELVGAARARPWSVAAKLVAAFLGFVLVCIPTMPLYDLEGLILLAVLCAVTWANVDALRLSDGAASSSSSGSTPRQRPIGARWQRDPATRIDRGTK